MARLLVVTGVLLAASAARLGVPCASAAEARCCASVADGDVGGPDRCPLDVLPVQPATASSPRSEWTAAPALAPRPVVVAREILPFAPKTSPPVVVA